MIEFESRTVPLHQATYEERMDIKQWAYIEDGGYVAVERRPSHELFTEAGHE